MLIETTRLTLRPWDPDSDLEAAYRIYSDPAVVRHIGGEARRIKSQGEMQDRLESLYHIRGDGLGRWAIETRKGHRVVGTVLLNRLQQGFGTPFEKVEVGWHLARDAWGNGYASEAGRAMLRYGFETLGLDVIFAVLNVENEASARVARRIGLTRIGKTERYYGQVLELFRISREEFRASGGSFG